LGSGPVVDEDPRTRYSRPQCPTSRRPDQRVAFRGSAGRAALRSRPAYAVFGWRGSLGGRARCRAEADRRRANIARLPELLPDAPATRWNLSDTAPGLSRCPRCPARDALFPRPRRHAQPPLPDRKQRRAPAGLGPESRSCPPATFSKTPAALGRRIAALLDTQTPVIGVTVAPVREDLKTIAALRHDDPAVPGFGGDDGLAVTAGWWGTRPKPVSCRAVARSAKTATARSTCT
jgi:hypothetical protein